MEMVLITGMAGAGKTSALDALEDIGFYAVDNLPLAMLEPYLKHCLEKGGRYSRTAAVIDLRSCHRYSELAEAYRMMQDRYRQDILYLLFMDTLKVTYTDNVRITGNRLLSAWRAERTVLR